jgi:hypothetical protein
MNANTEIPWRDEKLFDHKKQLSCLQSLLIEREKHVSSFFERLHFHKNVLKLLFKNLKGISLRKLKNFE